MNDVGAPTPGTDRINTSDIERFLKENRDKEVLHLFTCTPTGSGQIIRVGGIALKPDLPVAGQLAALCMGMTRRGILGVDSELVLLTDDPESDTDQNARPDSLPPSGEVRPSILATAEVTGQASLRSLLLGASNTDIALLLVDSGQGVTDGTRRGVYLAFRAGITHVIFAISGSDGADVVEASYDRIVRDIGACCHRIGLESFTAVPISASDGGNINRLSASMDWYKGQTLATILHDIDPDADPMPGASFRLLIQPATEGEPVRGAVRGFIASGAIHAGARVRIQPMGKESRVARVADETGHLDRAQAGQWVTLELDDASDIKPGSVISSIEAPAEVADQFEAEIVWMHDQPLYPGRTYLMKVGGNTVAAVVTDIKYEINIDTLEHLAANKLERDGIAVCNISLDRSVPFDPYHANKDLGAFTLVDRLSSDLLGVGMLNFALRRAHNIHLQHVDVDKDARAAHKGHRPCVLWFTGLSGSGKSTVANLVERKLHARGVHTYLLDGDNVRHGLSRDLGFTDADRVENIRRVAEVSKLMVDAGLIVITAFISPFRAERRMARGLFPEGEFFEVFMDTPLEVAEERDPKGLYKKARSGALKNFTGIDSPYEAPESPEVWLHTDSMTPDAAAEEVISWLQTNRLVTTER